MRVQFRSFSGLLHTTIVVFVLAGACRAFAAPWASRASDLPENPALVRGTLPNGLRYAILPNATPANRVTLRLLISVGANHERDDERGLAHFVEHMLFRGTRLHPADTLVTTLQRLGLGLGPDNAAFTSSDHTIYHLELPDTREATLRQGFEVFREYAEGATFDPAFIERERGVILSEKATRDTPGFRQSRANLAFIWPDARQARRPVIGVEETVKQVTRDQFVAFYDAWYRPERMAVIVVGNATPETATRLIEEIFSPLAARGAAREEPADIVPAKASPPNVFVHPDPAMLGLNLTFQHPQPYPTVPDTHETRVASLHRTLAFTMFQQRLNRIAQEIGDNLVAPSVSVGFPIQEWQLAAFSANAKTNSWQRLAASIELEQRRAMLHGFTASELTRARSAVTESIETSVRTAPTRRSEQLAGELVGTFLRGTRFTAPDVFQKDIAEALAHATAEDCLAAFRAAWERTALHVFANVHPSSKIDAASIAAVLNTSREQAALPRDDVSSAGFAYTDFGAPGHVVREQELPDLGVRLCEFANGVRLNFKSTDFEADVVEINLRVGAGKLTLSKTQSGLGLFSTLAFTGGGLGRHSAAEIGDLFAGRGLAVRFYAETDCMVFSARCSRRDLLPCLQTLAAYLTDAGYREEALRSARAGFGTVISNLQASPGGPFRRPLERILLKNDPRFGVPTDAEFYSRTLADMKAWIDPQLKTGAIEMSIVGDAAWDDVATAMNATLGALPARPVRGPVAQKLLPKITPTSGKTMSFVAPPQLKQSALAWVWPVGDPANIAQDRRSRLLAQALAERLRLRLRTELGSAYAPTAQYISDRGLPAFGYFLIYAEVDASRTAEAAKVMRKEIELLLAQGFTDDEFERVKQPFLRAREDDLRKNSYWARTVLADAQERPERIVAARDRATDTATITRPEIEKLLRNYMKTSKGIFFISQPGTQGPDKK